MASFRSLVVLLGVALMWASASADPETDLTGAEPGAEEAEGAEPEAAEQALLAERLEDRGIRAADPSPKKKPAKKRNNKNRKQKGCFKKCKVECKDCTDQKCRQKCKPKKSKTNTTSKRKNKKNCNKVCGKTSVKFNAKRCTNCQKRKNNQRKKDQRKNNPRKTKAKAKAKAKKKRINTKKTGKLDQRAATINLTCLTTAIKLIKFMKDNVGNFLLRHSRQQKQNSLSAKKLGKKGLFAEPAARLTQAGGGNKSNMTCGGSTTSQGAKQLLNLTSRLDNCSAMVQEACAQPAPGSGGINQTFMTDCYKKSKGYNTTLMTCMSSAIKGNDACSCFMDAKLVAAMTTLKNCSGKAEAKIAAATRTKCLTAMRSCNSDIEEAGRLQYTCKYTVADLKAMLAQISNNKAKVAAGQAKVKALTGVSAAAPGNSTNSSRVAREAEGPEEPGDKVKDLMATHGRHQGRAQLTRSKRETYTCASMATAVSACSAVVSSAPSSISVLTLCTITTTQTTITCTTTETAALQSAANSLDVSQRIFTAFIISLQAEIKDSAGAPVSDTELATLVSSLGGGGTSTKAASSRNRNILRKMIMDKMKK